MSTGINNTVKWTLTDGELVIEPVNGVSGVARVQGYGGSNLFNFCTGMTESEYDSVESIVYRDSVAFEVTYSGFPTERVVPKHNRNNWVLDGKVNTKITSIDVSGLDTTNVSSFYVVFDGLPALVRVVGLNQLNTSSVEEYDYMFRRTGLSEIDISGFENTDINTTSVTGMFLDNPYLQTIVLPTNFNLSQATETDDEKYKYSFGIAKGVQAKKGTVVVGSDEDFFKLSATSQGGTWVRDISGSAELRFNVNKITRDGNSAEMQYTYYTSSATAEVYLKETSQSSFPSTPSDTFSIEGTGTGSRTLTLSSDSAYDVMVKVYDGETTLYTYPSIDSNVLLFSVDEDGNAWARGDIEDGQGNVLADKADTSSLAAVATSGDYDDLSNKPTTPPDYIVEASNKDGWTYRKWKSGKVEAWYNYSGSAGTFNVWVSPIRYKDVTVSIPSGIFTASPKIFPVSKSNQFWVVHASPSSATSFTVRLVTVVSSSLTPSFRIYATSY